MWTYTHTDELYHYGVLGMKWGKRRAQRYDARANYINSKIQNKKDRGRILTVRDGNQAAKAAQLESRAKDLRSNKKVTLRESNRNARDARIKAVRSAKEHNYKIKAEKQEKLARDNDKRVKMYGKTSVKAANLIGIAGTAYGMHIGNQIIKGIGMSSMKSIANNPKMGSAALHTASILTVAGMGALTVSSLKRMNALGKDIKLTKEYDERQYMYKQAKKKK